MKHPESLALRNFFLDFSSINLTLVLAIYLMGFRLKNFALRFSDQPKLNVIRTVGLICSIFYPKSILLYILYLKADVFVSFPQQCYVL